MKANLQLRTVTLILWALVLSISLSLSSCFSDPAIEAVFTVDPSNPGDASNRFPLLSAVLAANQDLSLFNEVATTTRLTLRDGSTTSLGGLLTAYGAYTVFAPNNAAMEAWLADRGIALGSLKSALNNPELNQELSDLLMYHICLDSVPSSRFVDGRFPAKTILGSFLLMKLTQVGDKVSYMINRAAVVDPAHKDIRCRNGFLNIIDKALTPEGRSGGQIIAGLGSEFSIFKSLMASTGVSAQLDIRRDTVWAKNGISYTVVPRNYTVFAVHDSTFNNKGITTLDGLANWLDVHREFGNVQTVDELLVAFAQYHALNQLLFTSDIIKKCTPRTTVGTLAPNQPMSFNFVSQKIRINRDAKVVVDVPFFRGISVDMATSDISFSNGVMHYALGFVAPVATVPTAVLWDFGDQPGWNDHPNYRKKAYDINVNSGALPNMSWGGGANGAFGLIGNGGSTYLYGNLVNFWIGGNRCQWVTITTPTINKGKYKVWITYYNNGNDGRNPNSWWYHLKPEYMETPGQDLYNMVNGGGGTFTNTGVVGKGMESNPFRWSRYALPTDNEDILLNNGWKWSTARTRSTGIPTKLLGTVTVNSTGPQRFLWVNDRSKNGNPDTRLDCIQFIPTDQDQMYPKWDGCGTFYFRDAYDADSQPFDNTLNVASNDPWNCVIQVLVEPRD